MASRTLPNLGLRAFYALHESGWGDQRSEDILKTSVLVQGSVDSKVSAMPGSPTAGDMVICDEALTGFENQIAVYDDGAWVYYIPVEGWMVYNRADGYFEWFNGTLWSEYTAGGAVGGALSIVELTDSHTAILSEAGKYFNLDKATAAVFTIPAHAVVPYLAGTRLYVEQAGAGVVTIAGDTGVTVNSRGAVFDTAGQYAVAVAVKKADDLWTLSGDLA